MSDNTKIEWADATINAINGCSPLSPGCTNCFAMRAGGRNLPGHPSTGLTVPTKAGHVWTGEVRLNETALLQPLRWKRPRKIFWNAHGDLFHENVPDAWIDRVFATCALTPQHTHMILTKRSDRMREYVNGRATSCRDDALYYILHACMHPSVDRAMDRAINLDLTQPLPNAWLGVSVEDQTRADERVPDLLATPAAIRFISAEPLLGPIDLRKITVKPEQPCWRTVDALTGEHGHGSNLGFTLTGTKGAHLDWVIAGMESGGKARPGHIDWARALRDQCADTGRAFLFKQWGEWAPICAIDVDALEDKLYYRAPFAATGDHGRCRVQQLVMQASGRTFPMDEWSRVRGEDRASGDFAFAQGTGAMMMMRIGKKLAGRLLDGRTHDEFPA